MQKVTRGLYYQHTNDGWLCILTVPYETLLQGVQNILIWYGLGLLLFLLAAVGMWLRDRRISRAAKRTAETLQVMGNIYYAFHRINLVEGTYEMTKPSDYMREILPETKGEYDKLLKAIVSALDEALLLEETVVDGTFLNTTPQEMISFFLSQAGVSQKKLSSVSYPVRKILPIRRQNVVQAIHTINAAWGLKLPFFFSGGTFYWGEKPEQSTVYTFEYGVNIISLGRRGGVWELETVSVPFVRHSHKINVIHPQISGEQEVLKVISTTNDSGFIRTYIYF